MTQLKHACVFWWSATLVFFTGTVTADQVTVLSRPETVTLHGDPESTWVVSTSHKVVGEPRTVYRCTVEIRSQITSGLGNVSIRMVAKNDQSISYQGIAPVSAVPLDFTVHSTVFISHARTLELQAYYRLNRASGAASFRT